MKKSELTPEQKELLAMDIPEDIMKTASAELEMADELYKAGFEKFAAETAEEMDKVEKEEKEEEEKKPEKKLSEEEKKEASARGAFIARGYIDGLRKLGSEKHNDELHYLKPFLAEYLSK